jgi:hypothetical protein
MHKKQPRIQRDQKPSTVTPYLIEPFDDWDEARMTPPLWPPDIPEWLSLPTDDPTWMPGVHQPKPRSK